MGTCPGGAADAGARQLSDADAAGVIGRCRTRPRAGARDHCRAVGTDIGGGGEASPRLASPRMLAGGINFGLVVLTVFLIVGLLVFCAGIDDSQTRCNSTHD